MSATGSLGLLLERYAGIRSAVNAIWTCLIDSLTGPLNRRVVKERVIVVRSVRIQLTLSWGFRRWHSRACGI